MRSSLHRAFFRGLCVTAALALAPLSLPGEPRKAEETVRGQGKGLYEMYCSNCHGKSGLGDGPSGEILGVVPANLTRLNKLNKGEFPAERVHKSIDGREQIRGHGTRRMPIWGLAFQEYDRDTNQEAEVRFRIRSLVDYLRTIQE